MNNELLELENEEIELCEERIFDKNNQPTKEIQYWKRITREEYLELLNYSLMR